MCGLVAVIAKHAGGLLSGHMNGFTQMLFADQLRGVDGTGMFYNHKEGVGTLKQPWNATNFINTEEYKQATSQAIREGRFIVGHNRAATKGSHIWEHTHPFVSGNVTLVHNGTLNSHEELDAGVVVDSHAICNHISREGYEKTLKALNGAFALIWFDQTDNTLNLVRNGERPLHLIECTNCWIVSSELGLGLWIAGRQSFKVIKSFLLTTEILYQFQLENMHTYKEIPVEFYKPAPANSWYTRYFNGKDWKTVRQKNKKDNVIVLPPPKPLKEMNAKLCGTKIMFTPNLRQMKQSNPPTSIFNNTNEYVHETHFMSGKEHNGTNHVKFFSNFINLVKLEKATLLEGTISAIVYRNTGIIYTIIDVSPVEHRRFCTDCAEMIPDESLADSKMEEKGWLCPTCTMYDEQYADVPFH